MQNLSNTRLVIVGGGAGGASAAARARRLCEDCEIILFERGPHVSFANCGLPYVVGEEIAAPDSLLVQTSGSLKARFNLDVRINTEVIHIDRAARRIRVREGETTREYEEAYDALLLSTYGSSRLYTCKRMYDGNDVLSVAFVRKILEWRQPQRFTYPA